MCTGESSNTLDNIILLFHTFKTLYVQKLGDYHLTALETVQFHYRLFPYKYLGTHVDAALSRSAHIDCIRSEVQQRIYFHRRSFGHILVLLFQSITLYYAVWNQCIVQLCLCLT